MSNELQTLVNIHSYFSQSNQTETIKQILAKIENLVLDAINNIDTQVKSDVDPSKDQSNG